MYSVGIDLGGTIIKIGLTKNGEIINFTTFNAHSSKGLAFHLPDIEREIDKLLDDEVIKSSDLTGIGLAFPGIVNPVEKKVISTNGKYDDACNLPLAEWVRNKWNVDFEIDNDTRLATLGEWKYGAAKGSANMVMMTIGTGIGTGVVIDGTILYGEHFQAGSLGGHFIVDYKARKCTCGNIGCVEALSSSFFLPLIIKENNQVSEYFKKNATSYDFKQIFELAEAGSQDAIIIRNECMDVWSAGIINYIHAYDPEVIVLGGGVMKSEDTIIPYLKKRVDSLAWCPSGKVKIVASTLGNCTAILGIEHLMVSKVCFVPV
jgi:glucokinase